MSSFPLFIISTLVYYVNSDSCDYATFSVKTLYPPIPVGTFSFSTNRCQSLRAKLGFKDTFLGDFSLPFDGSFKLKCYKLTNEFYQIAVNLYDDPLCNDLIKNANDEPIYVDMNNNKFTIYNAIQFSLDSMKCDSIISKQNDDTISISCGISMEMANNCSWSDSQRYINITVPDSKCISLAPDFGSVLSIIPFEILPQELVENMETSSMEFKCCSSDNSLLINNYTDTTCTESPDSQFRINSSYNGQCFVIGNNEDVVEDDDYRYFHYDENEDDTYVYIMRWQCNSFEDDCDDRNIPIIDDSMLPQLCDKQCIENEKEQEAKSNKGDDNNNNNTDKKNKIIGVIAVVIGVIALFIIVIVSSVLYGRRKAMQNALERNVAGNINKKMVKADADKYEAFVSEPDEDINVVHIEDVNQATDNTTMQ